LARIDPYHRSIPKAAAGRHLSRWRRLLSHPVCPAGSSRRLTRIGADQVVNRTQVVVVGFFASVWLALVVIFIAEPSLYNTQLHEMGLAGQPGLRAAFVAAVGLLVIVLTIGTWRLWRWLFWLLVVAFAAGVVRIPLFAVQLLGLAPLDVPVWYAGLQAIIGCMQAAIAIAMCAGIADTACGAPSSLRKACASHPRDLRSHDHGRLPILDKRPKI
jgi:hypothetical protein